MNPKIDSIIQRDMHYLNLLSHSYRNIAEASTEIINLESILFRVTRGRHFELSVESDLHLCMEKVRLFSISSKMPRAT